MIVENEVSTEQELRHDLVRFQQQAIVIVDQSSYELAAQRLNDVKVWRKRWNEYWRPLIDNAHKSWKGLLEKFNEADAPAAVAEAKVKAALLAWSQEQERLRIEAQRKAQEEADRKAEAERAALAVQAEADGLSDEEVESLMASVPVEIAAPVQPTYQKASGLSTRDCWQCEVTDLLALCKAIGSKKFKLSPEDTAKAQEFFASLLRPQALASKSTLNIPGCRAVNKPILSGRIN